ncbi:MAG TPA: ammonia-dependent NAD(+) synthetase [Bacillota bacterium]|nr:ammonia-dependent NAD(+) synthetase [Bacillota bacterium]
MRELQAKIIQELGVKPTIDPKEEIRSRVQFLKAYVVQAKSDGFVLGISGGQDSSLAGRLAQRAVEELREETGKPYQFIAVRLPYGVQQDEEDAKRALDFIQPDRAVVYNIKNAVDAATDSFHESTGEILRDFHKGNTKARMRMIAQYAIGGQYNLLVIGTDHAAEAVTGFFTKYGDGGSDILPISGLSKRQGKELLKELGAEKAIYLKIPTADLLDQKPGQADETELGVTYEQIDDYLEGKDVTEDVANAIERRFLTTGHKRTVPVSPWDTWWK